MARMGIMGFGAIGGFTFRGDAMRGDPPDTTGIKSWQSQLSQTEKNRRKRKRKQKRK